MYPVSASRYEHNQIEASFLNCGHTVANVVSNMITTMKGGMCIATMSQLLSYNNWAVCHKKSLAHWFILNTFDTYCSTYLKYWQNMYIKLMLMCTICKQWHVNTLTQQKYIVTFTKAMEMVHHLNNICMTIVCFKRQILVFLWKQTLPVTPKFKSNSQKHKWK
jgi:hypothetical protein